MADADDDAALQTAIAASLADAATGGRGPGSGPRAAGNASASGGGGGGIVELSSDDDGGGGDDRFGPPAATSRPLTGSGSGTARGRGSRGGAAPPPTEAELDAVFSALAPRAVVDAASLSAASAALLGAPPDPDTLHGMLLLAHEAAGGARLGRLTRAEFGRLAKRLLGGG